MLKTAGLIAAIAALAVSTPAMADGVDPDAALECGVGHSFLGGLVEEDDPDFSSTLISTGGVWMALAYERFSGDEAAFKARVDTQAGELANRYLALTSEEEGTDLFVAMMRRCEGIRVANPSEYDFAEAMMAQAQ